MFDTKIGRFSPNTLRYMVVLGELNKCFGSLHNKNIVEVGSAYGGQCLIISKEHKFKSYTLVYIPDSIELSEKYFSNFSVDNVIYQTSEDIKPIKTDFYMFEDKSIKVNTQKKDNYNYNDLLNIKVLAQHRRLV